MHFFCSFFFCGESVAGSGDYKSMIDSMLGGAGQKADLRTEWANYKTTNIANDKLLNEHSHQKIKYQWYAYANSSLLNGMDASTKVISVTPYSK